MFILSLVIKIAVF
jgi:RNA-binding protein 26